MKQKHLYSLLDTSYATVGIVFHNQYGATDEEADVDTPDRFGRKGPTRNSEILNRKRGVCTYKVPLSWGVKLDDVVIVDTPQRGLATALVVRVDDTPQIDVDADFDYKWLVQRVDRSEYDALVDKERNFADTMIEIERVRQREALIADMHTHLPEGSAARRLFDTTVQVLEHKPSAPEAPLGGAVPGSVNEAG